MPESPAQRAARERNLAKGNPRAYKSGSSQGEPSDPPRSAQGDTAPSQRVALLPPPGSSEGGYVRAKASAKAPPRKRSKAKASSSRPATPTPAQAAPDQPAKTGGGGGGFLDGLREAFGG
jgi:hypothetical protein